MTAWERNSKKSFLAFVVVVVVVGHKKFHILLKSFGENAHKGLIKDGKGVLSGRNPALPSALT